MKPTNLRNLLKRFVTFLLNFFAVRKDRSTKENDSPSADTRLNERTLVADVLEPRILYSAAPAEAPADAIPADEAQPTDEAPPTEAAAAEAAPPAEVAPAADTAPAVTGDTDIAGDQSVTLIDLEGEASVDEVELQSVAEAAAQRWEESGLSAEQSAALASITYQIGNLSGTSLASYDGASNVITVDPSANGVGWFVDSTPEDDDEYGNNPAGNGLVATADDAQQGVDLLTVILHEQGHAIGIEDSYELSARGDIMFGGISAGQRSLPTVGQAEGAIAGSLDHVANVNMNITTLTDDPVDAVLDTLREAVLEANSTAADDTITLGAGTFTLSIAGTGENAAATGDLDVVSSSTGGTLTIAGAGKGVTFVDAQQIDRVFHLLNGANVTFQDLTITGGFLTEDRGGGIYNDAASLTLTNVDINGNEVQDDSVASTAHALGGGLYNNGRTIVATNTDFTDNKAIRNGGDDVAGGGGYFSSGGNASLNMTGGSFSGNEARDGGGFYIWSGGSTMTMDGVTIDGNRANSVGGGFRVIGRGSEVNLLNGSSISNNSANSNGAGFYVSEWAEVTMNDGTAMTITGNKVEDAGGTVSQGAGGGFYATDSSQITLDNVTISGNEADDGAGFQIHRRDTTVTGTNLTIENNIAEVRGGGFRNAQLGAIVDLSNSVIQNNVSETEHGGGFYNNGTVILDNVPIQTNTTGTNTADYGGGFYNNLGDVTITGNSLIDGNTSTGHAGGFWNRNGTVTIDGSAGANITNNVAGFGNTVNGLHAGGFFSSDGATTNLTDVDFTNNTVSANGGGDDLGSGAGFFADSGSLVNLTDVNISNHNSYQGGAFYVTGAHTKVVGTRVTLDSNTARLRGGAFQVANTLATVELTDSSIDGNTATNEHGGGFYNSGTVTLDNTDVSNSTVLDLDGANRRDAHGGGFYNGAGVVNLTNGSYILGNSSYGYGGGFWNNGGEVNVTDSLIDSNFTIYNNSSRNGGGFWNSGDATTNLTDTTVSNNYTGADLGGTRTRGVGGGFYNNGGYVNISGDSQIIGNRAEDGGGFYSDTNGSIVTITGTALNPIEIGTAADPNTARVRGGGFRTTGGTNVILDNVDIQYNTTDTQRGGGFYSDGAQVTGTNVKINNNATGTDGRTGDEQGGGFWSDGNSTTSLTDSEVNDNTSLVEGGGFLATSAVINLTRTNVEGNFSQNSGGGVRITGSSVVTAVDSSISNNISRDHGGGFYISDDSKATLTRTLVDGNLAGYESDGTTRRESGTGGIGGAALGDDLRGGGFRALGRAQVNFVDSTISNNEAARFGGAFDAENEPNISLIGTTVTGNVSDNHGGAIRLASNAHLAATNSTISGNYSGFAKAKFGGTLTANYDGRVGGGIWSQSGGNVTTFNHVTMTDNYATAGGAGAGAGIYRSGGSVTIENSIIYGNIGDADLAPASQDAADVRSSATLVGGNVVGVHSSGTLTLADGAYRITADPVLGALADNGSSLSTPGGVVQTHAILGSSVAADAAVGSRIATDQLGNGRGAGSSAVNTPVLSAVNGADLLTDTNVTIGTPRVPVINTNTTSLDFPAGAGDNEFLFDVDVAPAAALAAGDLIQVTVVLDYTRPGGDHDPLFRLTDGSNNLDISLADNSGGSVSGNGLLLSGTTPPVSGSSQITLTYSFSDAGNTLTASEGGQSNTNSGTGSLNASAGLTWRMRAGNSGELFQVDVLDISYDVISAAGDIGAYEVAPVATTLTLDEMSVPENAVIASGASDATVDLTAAATTTGAGPLNYDWTATDQAGNDLTVTGDGTANASFTYGPSADDPIQLVDVVLTVTDAATGQLVTSSVEQVRFVDPTAMPTTFTAGSLVVDKLGDELDGFELNYDGETGNFIVGATVTGATTGTQATILGVTDNGTDGTLLLQLIPGTGTGNFADDEALTDDSIQLNFDAETANFNVGQIVTGSISTASATILAVIDNGTDGTLVLGNVTGTFQDDEPISDDGTVPGVADADGTTFSGAADADGSLFGITLREALLVANASGAGNFEISFDAGITDTNPILNSLTLRELNYDTQPGGVDFVVGETITGATDFTEAVVVAVVGDSGGTDSNGRLVLSIIPATGDGNFNNNESLIGSVSGTGAALANGTLLQDNNTGYDYDITKTNGLVVIQGNGTTNTIVDGDGLDRVFDIRPNAQVIFKDLTVQGGSTTLNDHGGGVRNLGGTGIFQGVDIANNASERGSNAGVGGGIYTTSSARSEGFIFMKDGSIAGNSSGGNGGGLYMAGTNVGESILYLDGTTISSNTAASQSTTVDDRRGGGFFITDDGNRVVFNDVEVSDNLTAGRNRNDGGGGAFGGSDYTVEVTGGSFLRNQAGNGALSGGANDNDGGGFWVGGTRQTLTFDGTQIGGELAGGADAAGIGAARVDGNIAEDDGGGFYDEGRFNTLNLIDTEIIGNRSNDSGGGFMIASDSATVNITQTVPGGSVIRNNFSATEHGGGFRNDGILNITGSAASPFEIRYNEVRDAGGADRVGGGFYATNNGTVTLTDADIHHNQANTRGGGFFASGGATVNINSSAASTSGNNASFISQIRDNVLVNAAGDGGGFYTSSATTAVNLTDVLITGHNVGDEGGGFITESNYNVVNLTNVDIVNNIAQDNGGGFYNRSNGSVMTMSNVLIDSNQSVTEQGGGFRNNGIITGNLVTITNNEAGDGTGTGDYRGGGFYNSTGRLTLEDVVIENNIANSRGGGFANVGGGIVTITSNTIRSSISNNLARTNDGGGVYQETSGSNTILNGVDVVGNTSGDDGGGLYLASDGGRMELTDVLVSGNDSDDDGGGIFNASSGSVLVLNNVAVTSNTTNTEHGGGISNRGTISGANVTISDNDTGITQTGGNDNNVGGGLYSAGTYANVNLTGVNISDNDSYGRGGGIYNSEGILNLTDFVISGNTTDQSSSESQGRGGGIWNNAGGELVLNRGTVSNNQSFGHGGGIYQQDNVSSLDATNVTISNNLAGWDKSDNAFEAGRLAGGLWALSVGSVSLRQTTVTDNRNTGGGGAIRIDSGKNLTTIENSVIFGNTRNVDTTPVADDFDNNVGTDVTFVGANVVGVSSGTVSGGTLLRTDPNLDALADNAGPSVGATTNGVPNTAVIQTHAIAADSLATNAAIGSVELVDARGEIRNPGGQDLGAFELSAPRLDAATITIDPASLTGAGNVANGGTVTLTAEVIYELVGGAVFEDVTVTVDWDDGSPLSRTVFPAGTDFMVTSPDISFAHVYGYGIDGQYAPTVSLSFTGLAGVAATETLAVTVDQIAALTGTTDEDNSVILGPNPDASQTGTVASGQLLVDDADPIPDLNRIGHGVSIDGDWAVIGGEGQGHREEVHIYHFTGGSWVLEQTLLNINTVGSSASVDDFDDFGYAVKVDSANGRIFIGEQLDDTGGSDKGAVSFYEFDGAEAVGSQWVFKQKIQAAVGSDASDYFGSSVDAGGDFLVVGATLEDADDPADQTDVAGATNSGATYVFKYNSGTGLYELEQKLKAQLDTGATDVGTDDRFGISVAINELGTALVVGAYLEDTAGSNSGAAYVYTFDGGEAVGSQWSISSRLQASDAAANDQFGYRVDISGETAVVGARLEDTGGTDSGAVYIFKFDTLNWVEDQILGDATHANITAYDYFGGDVAIEGDRLIVGAYLDDPAGSNSGRAYIFDRTDPSSSFTLTEQISATEATARDEFGFGVAISGDRFLVGARLAQQTFVTDDGAVISLPQFGAGYIFEGAGAPAQVAKLDGDIANADDIGGRVTFGRRVSVGGDWAVVGAPEGGKADSGNGDEPTGVAYLYHKNDMGTADASDDTWSLISTLRPPDTDDDYSDTFGQGVTISEDGSTIAIGAPTHEAGGSNQGAAYIYKVNTANGDVSFEGRIRAAARDSSDYFGHSLSLNEDGSVLAVGMRYDDDGGTNTGSLHVYTAAAGDWNTFFSGAAIEQGIPSVNSDGVKLKAQNTDGSPDAGVSDEFGRNVRASGDRIVVGVYLNDDVPNTSGSAYVYKFDGANWVIEQKLTASNAGSGDSFGISADIDGDTIVVGAYLEDSKAGNAGSAYVYEFNSGTSMWDEVQRIEASDGSGSDLFGRAVSVDNGVIVVGSYLEDTPGSNGGSAYVYQKDAGQPAGSQWIETDILRAPDGSSSDGFGLDVSVSEGNIVVGAYQADRILADGTVIQNFGAAYTYRVLPAVSPMVTITSVSATASGKGTVTTDGTTITFDPGSDFNNLDLGDSVEETFTYTIVGGETATVTVTVEGVNDTPTIDTAATANVAEGTTAVINVDSTDPEGLTEGAGLTYSISGGADSAAFSIDAATGALVFNTAPDFETPTDAGTDNVYDVQVQVTDGTNNTTQDIAVTVTDVNEAPTIDTAATANVAENTTAVINVDSTDPEGLTEGAGLNYSISGGADSAAFSIDASTGALVFNAAPDFETPTDTGTNNVYDVQVQVSDGTNNVTQDIAVTVTDVVEGGNTAPVITTAATANVAEGTTAVIDVDSTDDTHSEGAGLTYVISGGADSASFSIDAATGALVFTAAPDFEAPADAGTNNVYDVQVSVTDSDGVPLTTTQDITVTVTDVNEAPTIDTAATANVAEGTTAVINVDSTDPEGLTEGAGLTYSISGGADSASFSIDAASGALVFSAAPDFEAPADAGTNNVYDVQVQVTDGTNNVTQDIAVTVTDVDEAPTIDTAATANVAEGTTAVINVDSTDPEGLTEGAGLTYSISGGADSASFSIDAASGALVFNAAPDFEAPADAGTNNVYDVQVQVTDGTNNVTQDIAVTVTDVNEAPTIDTAATANVAEGTTAVINVNSTDPEGLTEGAGLTYSISGGADSASFSIDAASGALVFSAAPDFEAPADAGTNNVYDVQVQVTDGTNNVTQDIAVTVTDVDEAPTIDTAATANVAEGTTAVINVDSTDPEGLTEGAGLTYSISGGADSASFSIDAATGALVFNAAPDFEAPADAGTNNIYDVQVQVTDGTNNVTQDIAVTVTDVVENAAPTITSPATANVAENTTAVIDVQSTDDLSSEGSGLTYSISGGADSASFSIDAATGDLVFTAAPDFEAPADAGTNNVYDVQVQVTDGTNNTTQDIVVTVTDVDEAPTIDTAATANVVENTTAVINVDSTDPEGLTEGAGLTYSISGGADSAAFSIDAASGALVFSTAPDFDIPGDAGADNVYDVQVQVSDGTNDVTQDIAVTVTNVDEAPVISTPTAVTADEEQTSVVDIDSTDPEGVTEGGGLTYSITGGADSAAFSIDAASGELVFNAAPDFEVPTDAGTDNVYDVQVTVTDGTTTPVTHDMTVTINDVVESALTTTTGVFLSGTTLQVLDINGEDTADQLAIYVDGTDLVIEDIGGTNDVGFETAGPAAVPGATQVTSSQIRVALVGFTNLEIDTKGNDDLISIGDLTGLLGSVTVIGGDAFDTITLTGNSALASNANASITGEHIQGTSVTLTTAGTGTIDLTGNGGNATAGSGSFHGVFLRESVVGSETGDISITGSGSAGSVFNDGVQLMNTNISTTDASITISGTGSEGIRSKGVNLLPVAGQTVGSTLTVGGSGNLTVDGVGGTGSFQNEGVSLTNSGLSVADGDISITGTGGAGNFGGVGIKFTGSTLDGTGAGNISITGTSAATGGFFNGGIELKTTTINTVGTGSGSDGLVTIVGTGSGNGTLLNDGVKLIDTDVTAGLNSAIDIDGTSSGSTVGNNGVFLTTDSDLAVSGLGTVTIDGTGSALGTVNNDGVFLGVGTDLDFENGDVTITGTGGTGSQGVQTTNATMTGTGSGNINITGVSVGTGGINQGISLGNSTLTTAAGSGDITLQGTGSADGTFSNDGIILITSHLITGSNASVDLDGVGGGAVAGTGFFNTGVQFKANSTVVANGSGTVTIDGTGGDAKLINRGVWLQNTSTISSGSGAITINGTGNGSSLFNQGIFLSTASVSTTGDITLLGTGSQSATSVFNTGVSIGGPGSISAGGTLTITGTGGTGSTLNEGVRVLGATLSGNLQLTGTAHASTTAGVLNTGVYMLNVNLGGATAGSSIIGFGGATTSLVGNLNHGIYMNTIAGGFLGTTTGTTGFGALSKDKTGNFFP